MMLEELKLSVVTTGRQMIDRGLVAGTWGNISVRNEDGSRIVITPSGRPL